MNNYEAMLLIRPDLSEEEKTTVFNHINQLINNKAGKVHSADVWAAKRKLFYKIKSTLTSGGARRYNEALFYLVIFELDPLQIAQLRRDFKLNDSIMRVLILQKQKAQ
jgi:small subunit ribosomal protein S6